MVQSWLFLINSVYQRKIKCYSDSAIENRNDIMQAIFINAIQTLHGLSQCVCIVKPTKMASIDVRRHFIQ